MILPGGEIAARSTIGDEATLSVPVPLVSPQDSLVMRWGDWFGWASLVLGLLMMIALRLVPAAGGGLVSES